MFRSHAFLRLAPAPALTTALLATVVACGGPREVAVRVSIPGPDSVETPVTGVGLVALPYDRDSVLRALEARARTPRPPSAPLESLFAAFRGPFTAYSATTYRLGKLRDSLAASKAELDTLPRNAPAYARIHEEFGRLSDSLSAGQARAERARDELDRARREFVTRSDTLRLRMRQWEDSTYQGYDSIVRGLALRAGHDAVTDTTGADGWAHLKLPPGRWWVYARSWDATDPNAEWYWNLPATDDTLLLSSRNARRQPRY
ncbi:MAG TPA: hypothetical protein VHL81_02020 [Gemmatimonadales bacterium]|nr:hypothetical protein [Gemmatimonadales bacterium]